MVVEEVPLPPAECAWVVDVVEEAGGCVVVVDGGADVVVFFGLGLSDTGGAVATVWSGEVGEVSGEVTGTIEVSGTVDAVDAGDPGLTGESGLAGLSFSSSGEAV